MIDKSSRIRARLVTKHVAVVASLLLIGTQALANYSCRGLVGYLGVSSGGEVTVSVANSTPIHYICNLASQGGYSMSVPSCKAAYATLLSARLTGKSVGIYYGNEPVTCNTLPSWGAAPSAYFIEGPD